MIIQEIDPECDERWDAFVADHPYGTFCHLSLWKKVLESSFRHMTGHFLAIVDASSNAIVAGLPVFAVKSRLLGNRLVSIPFASLCDPLVTQPGELGALLKAATSMMDTTACDRLSVRSFRSEAVNRTDWPHSTSPFVNHHLDLHPTEEALWANLHARTRQNIRRSMKHGLLFRCSATHDDLRVLFDLYAATRRRLGLPPQPFDFFDSIHRHYLNEGLATIVIAEKAGIPISAAILFFYRDRVLDEFRSWDRNYNACKPNYFLLWESIRLAQRMKFNYFDLGRTHTMNTGLIAFKARWGTQVTELQQIDIPESPAKCSMKSFSKESKTYGFAKRVCRRVPAPILNRIGAFCYKHMG